MYFAVPADHRGKLKESEKRDKYLDLVRSLKKLWNIKVTVIPVVIGTLSTVTNGNKRMSTDHPNYSIVEIDQEYSEEEI